MAKRSKARDRGPERARAAAARVHVRPASEGEGGPNRKVRKEEARQQRERIQRRMARRRRGGQAAAGLLVIAIAAVVIVLIVTNDNSSGTSLPGMLTSDAPWPANTADLRERLREIGFPALGQEMTAQHTHEHLDIFVDGEKVQVPPDIGIGNGFLSPLHTHDPATTTTSDSATIHVEAPDQKTYTLGEFFDVWGVRLTSSCLGGYCNGGGKSLQAFVNGKPVTTPRDIPLKEHEEIVLAYGSPADLPSKVPSTFDFIKGE